MFLTDVEKIGDAKTGLIIYWIGDKKKLRQYGIVFPGHKNNITRQGFAESVPLATELACDLLDDLIDNSKKQGS